MRAVSSIVSRLSSFLFHADRIRAWFFQRTQPYSSFFLRRRELRVAAASSLQILIATFIALAIPLWSITLGPLLLGVPHVLADLRYLVVRPGFHRKTVLWLLAGIPILIAGLGGGLKVALLGVLGVILWSRQSPRRRLLFFITTFIVGFLIVQLGRTADVLFVHLHHLVTFWIWWQWRKREQLWHWVPLLLLGLLSFSVLQGSFDFLFFFFQGWKGPVTDLNFDEMIAWLAPGVDPLLGMRLMMLFALGQAIHYGIWLRFIPEEERKHNAPPPFRKSFQALVQEMGVGVLLGGGFLFLLFAFWGIFNLFNARMAYLHFAGFHGYLEIVAMALFGLERRRLE